MNAVPPSQHWKLILAIVASLGATALPGARADALYSGATSGIFSDPVLSGSLIAVDGTPTAYDNTATAVVTGVGTNSITWGTNTGGPLISSTVTFTGKTFSNVAPGQLFDLGTITYTNGTSALDSIIFGSTFTLSIAPPAQSRLALAGPTIDPAVSQLGFLTTANHTPADARLDADFITFSAFPQSFNVFEGATASAELFGRIVGDPQLTLSSIKLNPGQSSSGFIGNGVHGVPEGGSTGGLLGLAMLSLLGLGRLARRRLLAA